MKQISQRLTDQLNELARSTIEELRQSELDALVQYILDKQLKGETAAINFICTHNSRRSQLGQIWAGVTAHIFGLNVDVFSGGTEVTTFHPNAIASLRRSGFEILEEGSGNKQYRVQFVNDTEFVCYSKLYDAPENPTENFAAVMTCSSADENCPFIPGAEKRFPIRYEDPKEFDGTPQEEEVYDERSLEIAKEMFYVMKNVRNQLNQ